MRLAARQRGAFRTAGSCRPPGGVIVPPFLAMLLGGVAGCFDPKGIDPPTDRFFFPTGMALTAGGRYLLVANSNFDLQYNAGTVVAVDLARVDAAIARCAGHCPEARDEALFLVPESTVAIGSRATDLAVSPDGTRVYVTVPGNGSLTWLELDETAADRSRLLSCFDDQFPASRRCRGRYEVVRTGHLWVPAEPYALLALDDWVVTGHVDSGDVALFDVGRGRAPAVVRVLGRFLDGVNGFARQPFSDWVYVVGRTSSLIQPFTVSMPSRHAGEGPAVSLAPAIEITSNRGGADCRSLAFSPDGTRAFVTNREPPSLIVFDSTPRPDGSPSFTPLATIELAAGPSKVAVQPLPGGGYVVLVVCFDAEELFVVDPVLLAVVDVRTTGVGPHAVVADPAAQRVYLGNFGESTIWVLDFDPRSPYYAQVVLRIGTRDLPGNHD